MIALLDLYLEGTQFKAWPVYQVSLLYSVCPSECYDSTFKYATTNTFQNTYLITTHNHLQCYSMLHNPSSWNNLRIMQKIIMIRHMGAMKILDR